MVHYVCVCVLKHMCATDALPQVGFTVYVCVACELSCKHVVVIATCKTCVFKRRFGIAHGLHVPARVSHIQYNMARSAVMVDKWCACS